MVRVQQRLGVSERRACEVLGQARSTQRRSRKRGADEAALRADVVKVAGRFGRYGYRMVTGMLRAEGWVVNHRSSPELCVKVRGSSSMLLLGCLGDLLRFEKREIQVATFAPDRSSP